MERHAGGALTIPRHLTIVEETEQKEQHVSDGGTTDQSIHVGMGASLGLEKGEECEKGYQEKRHLTEQQGCCELRGDSEANFFLHTAPLKHSSTDVPVRVAINYG